jgi:predicted  nucleic acid-binding Zn-ribbon protein
MMPNEPRRAELEHQLADAHARIREMIHEIDRRDELISELQRRIQELEGLSECPISGHRVTARNCHGSLPGTP